MKKDFLKLLFLSLGLSCFSPVYLPAFLAKKNLDQRISPNNLYKNSHGVIEKSSVNKQKLLLEKSQDGVLLVKGIDLSTPIKEKIYNDCGTLYWAKQLELLMQLESLRKISDQTAIRFLQEHLEKKYQTEVDFITRMGFELYSELTLLERDRSFLFEHKASISEQDFAVLTTCVNHYLSVLGELNQLVNIIIMGYSGSKAISIDQVDKEKQ